MNLGPEIEAALHEAGVPRTRSEAAVNLAYDAQVRIGLLEDTVRACVRYLQAQLSPESLGDELRYVPRPAALLISLQSVLPPRRCKHCGQDLKERG